MAAPTNHLPDASARHSLPAPPIGPPLHHVPHSARHYAYLLSCCNHESGASHCLYTKLLPAAQASEERELLAEPAATLPWAFIVALHQLAAHQWPSQTRSNLLQPLLLRVKVRDGLRQRPHVLHFACSTLKMICMFLFLWTDCLLVHAMIVGSGCSCGKLWRVGRQVIPVAVDLGLHEGAAPLA